MKRPNFIVRWVLGLSALVVVSQYAVLAWLVPRFVVSAIEHATGGDLLVDRTRLSFPFTTTLTGIRTAHHTEGAALSIQRIVIRPRWLSVPRRTIWLDAVEIERPLVRVTRSRKGVTHWPAIRRPFRWDAALGLLPWRVRADSIIIADGTLEFLDYEPAAPFHGVLDHVSMSLGPALLPLREAHRVAQAEGRSVSLSFAVRGRFASRQGGTSPYYCSGWVDLSAKDLQAACQVEPVPLAAFESYVRGETQLRAYSTTIQSASHWVAKSNQLNGRLQMQLGNLTEGDFSFRGRTVLDVKKMFGTRTGRLIGSMTFKGPLDHPEQWEVEFVAGDPQVQALVERLFEYGVRVIKVPIGSHALYVRIAPSTPEMMTDIEAVSREVEEALQLLAEPAVEVSPPPAPPEPPAPPLPDPASEPPVTSVTL
jgi:hypothetical protein